jgi:hypothetical protein
MNSPSNHIKLGARDLEDQALDLRRVGWSYKMIAAHLDKSISAVGRAVRRALKRLNEKIMESAAEVRRIELERYDEYLYRLQPGIERGCPRAITTALAVSKRRAELLGLDIPVKQSIQVDSTAQLDDEQMKDALKARGLLNENTPL